MATFHSWGVPVTIGGVVPYPDDLAEEYKEIYDNNDASGKPVQDTVTARAVVDGSSSRRSEMKASG